MAKEMSEEHLAKMKEAREEKNRKDKEERENLLREIDTKVRSANKDKDEEEIQKLIDEKVKVIDADAKIVSAFNVLQKVIVEKAKLSSKGKGGEVSAKQALRIIQKSL